MQDPEKPGIAIAERRIRSAYRLLAGSAVAFFTIFYFGRLMLLAYCYEYWKTLSLLQFPAMVGLPAAAVSSLFLVLVLRAEAGPLEFKALGFEFRGASGPVVLWVVSFLAISIAIHLLWIDSPVPPQLLEKLFEPRPSRCPPWLG